MYSNKLVMAIKHNGKILRETKDIVHLPFGSEFSVLVKNLDSRRVKYKLHIDGADVLGDTSIIVNANSESEIKRFIRNGNMDSGNAFKFIERTTAIEDGPRGVKIEDGIVRIEFWFENKPTYLPTQQYWKQDFPIYGDYIAPRYKCPTSLRGFATAAAAGSLQSSAVTINEVGITVPGSQVDQKFTVAYGFTPELHSNVIILKLVGQTETKIITQAVTVEMKPKCITCGYQSKVNSRFCSSCGTSLLLL
jgi:hypothetical protein